MIAFGIILVVIRHAACHRHPAEAGTSGLGAVAANQFDRMARCLMARISTVSDDCKPANIRGTLGLRVRCMWKEDGKIVELSEDHRIR